MLVYFEPHHINNALLRAFKAGEMRSHFFWVNWLIMFPTRRHYVHRRILVKSKFCSTARKDARKREQDIIKISKKAIYFMKLQETDLRPCYFRR